ncbi:probable carboxylesterase 2 [Lolium perenne]|uniref:probable carboxylesterase 2 n=1 Tax=Lolium perenne TaxID=4522 RepID=UPI0021EAFA87|nr:probable carboxylesterase 2 [Lolium perenne]
MATPRAALLASLLVALCCCSSLRTGLARSGAEEEGSALRSRGPYVDEVKFDFTPFLIQYRSGRVQRLMGTSVVPPSLDARTGVASRDVVIDRATGLAVRVYRPSQSRTNKKLPVLLYFHGGAFVVESAFGPAYHGYLNALAARAGVIAVSVNYRLAPEHPLPAAYDDSWAALQWVLSSARNGSRSWLARHGDMSRLFVGGDSAGGNIAHNLAMRAGGEEQSLVVATGSSKARTIVRIRGVALLDPYFLGARAGPWAERAWGFICAGRYGTGHPYVDPAALPAGAWRRLGGARVLVTVSGRDRLGPWQSGYVGALRGSGWGGEARLYETPGEGHCFFLNYLASPKAAMHMATLADFVNQA